MYRIRELETLLKCTYPKKKTLRTQRKREENITALQNLIRSSIETNELVFEQREERLKLYETAEGEKIYIQYPGKESVQKGDNKRPYDFRPKILTPDGNLVIDLQFKNIWGILEDLNHQQHKILKLMSCIFFRMGRMLNHQFVDECYPCETINSREEVIERCERRLAWNRFSMDNEILESLNFHCDKLMINSDVSISMEAFLCFFDLLMNNEDSKYYYGNNKLTDARINTGDSMLLLSSTLHGNIRLSTLLQKFVSGYGVCHCNVDEIEPATNNLVHIIDFKSLITNTLHRYNLNYRNSATIRTGTSKIKAMFRIDEPRIAILNTDDRDANSVLSAEGWTVFFLDDLLDETQFADFEERLVNYNEASQSL